MGEDDDEKEDDDEERMMKMIKILTRMMGLIRGWVRKPMGSLRGDGTC